MSSLRADIEATVKEWRKEADKGPRIGGGWYARALTACADTLERLLSQHTKTKGEPVETQQQIIDTIEAIVQSFEASITEDIRAAQQKAVGIWRNKNAGEVVLEEAGDGR